MMSTRQTKIPKGWLEVKIGDVLDVNPEQINPTDSPDDFFQYIDIAAVKDFGIRGIKTFTGTQAPGRARRVVREGDILVSNVRPNLKGICRVPTYDVNTLCSTGFSVVRAKTADERYAYQVLSQDKFTKYLIDKTIGSNYPAVNSKDVADYLFLLPETKEEQKKIAEILSTMDEEIEKTEEVIVATEKLKRGLMQKLFTQGIGHTKFKKTKIGEIPEEWEVSRFDMLATLQRGFDLPAKQRVPGPFPLVSSSGVTDMHAESRVNGPGVITGRSGTIGNVTYIEHDYWPLNTTLYVKDFHGNMPKFVYYFLQHFKLNRFHTGTGVPTLNRNNVHSEKIAFPKDKKEQKKIAEIISSIDEKISINKKLKEKLTKLKKGLMQDLLSGDVRVNM